jgi:hypothetical protein
VKLLPDAVKAVQKGFHIFPVEDFGKTPHTTTPPYTIKWSDVATNDLNVVLRLWNQWPEANVGVACKPSGLLVVDCDIPKTQYALSKTKLAYMHEAFGPLVDGESVFNEVCHRYGGDWAEVESTYCVSTGSGGLHYYFRWPSWLQASQASIVKGVLDIRCNGGERGGYVLGEGSETTKGPYVRRSKGVDVLDAPDWLVELCKERARPSQPAASPYEKGGSVNYGGLAESVAYAQEGNRNNCLLWAARSMCSDGATQEEAMEVLGEAARTAGLTEIETRDTIRSAYRLQGNKA